MTKSDPFKGFQSSLEIIRLVAMLYIRFPLSLRNVVDLLLERGVEIRHETVRFWWRRFGPMFAGEIRKRRIERLRSSRWRWHLDKIFVKINGERHYLCRAVDHEGDPSAGQLAFGIEARFGYGDRLTASQLGTIGIGSATGTADPYNKTDPILLVRELYWRPVPISVAGIVDQFGNF